MAITDKGSLGATGSSANNQATLVLTTALTIAVGELAVIVVAVDNLGTADGDNGEVTSVTNSGTAATWIKAKQFSNAQGAAQAGACVSIWYAIPTVEIASGATITITFSNATTSDASGVTGRVFQTSLSNGWFFDASLTNTLANDAADPASLDVTTPNLHYVRIRGIAAEVGNNTNLTPTTNFTAWANGNSATTGTTAEMCARAEHRISTATSDASNPTYVAADCASAYVVFREGDPKSRPHKRPVPRFWNTRWKRNPDHGPYVCRAVSGHNHCRWRQRRLAGAPSCCRQADQVARLVYRADFGGPGRGRRRPSDQRDPHDGNRDWRQRYERYSRAIEWYKPSRRIYGRMQWRDSRDYLRHEYGGRRARVDKSQHAVGLVLPG